MNFRSHTLVCTVALALALLLGSALVVVAAPHYAVAASLGKVYLITYDNGTVSSSTLSELGSSNLAGIAAWSGHDNQIFVADNASQGDSVPRTLRVGKIVNIGVSGANPSIQWLDNPIPLTQSSPVEQIKSPTSVEVDTDGKVYVVGGRWRDTSNKMHSGYACVTSSNAWADAASSNVTIVSRSQATLSDLTIDDSNQPFFALQDLTADLEQSCAAGAGFSPLVAISDGYSPQAITTGNNRTYIANDMSVSDPNSGSISCLDHNLGQLGTSVQLGSFLPSDIEFFTVDGNSYLGLVGTAGQQSQAWRVLLDPSTGLPQMDSVKSCNLDGSAAHFCTVSSDNTVFWATNPQSGTVAAINTSAWTAKVVTNLTNVSHIASLDITATPTVPKPWLAELPTQVYRIGRPFVGPQPQFIAGQAGSTFALQAGPAGMSIDANTGVVTWTNPVKSNQLYTVIIAATNAGGMGTTQFVLSQWCKQAQDGDIIATARVAVTTKYAQGFCIESIDRLWGMFVQQSNPTVSLNQLVDVRGVMHTDEDGNRYIAASGVTTVSGTRTTAPIYIPMRHLCGGGLMWEEFGITSGQRGATGGKGVNNVGLYVKVSGTVASISDDLFEITIDDGSNAATTVDLTAAATNLQIGDYVTVDGICKLFVTDEGDYIRGIRTRDAYSIQIVPKTQTQP